MPETCASCGYQNADDARFCAGCGTPLADAPAATAPVEERRVVSILFADLAGFTSRSDQADPEVLRVCLAAGEIELAAQALGDRPVHVARTQHAVLTGKALLTEAHDDLGGAADLFAEAAAAWASCGDPFERAHALEGWARCLERLERGMRGCPTRG